MVSPEAVKEKDKKLDRKEEEEKGWEYLNRLDEEEASTSRAQFEEQFGPDSDGGEEDMEDFEIPQELLEEFCKDAEFNPVSGEFEPPKKRPKLNTMKIPNLILMALKNNTSDQEAADIATG